MKCHLAVGSHLQSDPVFLITLLEDDPLLAHGVAGNTEQLNPCIGGRDSGDACLRIDLKDGILNVQRLAVAVCDIPRAAGFGAECFSGQVGIKFMKRGVLL